MPETVLGARGREGATINQQDDGDENVWDDEGIHKAPYIPSYKSYNKFIQTYIWLINDVEVIYSDWGDTVALGWEKLQKWTQYQ